MKTDFIKGWRGKNTICTVGIALYYWGLPFHLTYRGERWFVITFLCFYLEVEWGIEPDLADRMVQTLEKE